MERIPYHGRTLIRWTVGGSQFLALPELGARLMNWSVTHGDGSVRDVIHWPEVKAIDGFARIRGGNPILFPFCARSFDRGEIHRWRGPDGTVRPMPMHGFARDGEFTTTRLDARGFSAQLVPGETARAAYPYDYEFTVRYRFEPAGLTCDLTLKNLGAEPIPWSAGHHFYFTLPWSDGLGRADYLVRIPAGSRLRQDASGALVPGPALRTDESFANPALVDTIHAGLKSNEVVFGERGRAGDILIRIGPDRTPPAATAVVTWTEKEDSPFYCVEPWMGPPNSFENKFGFQMVRPGESQTFTVSVVLK